jgi:phosphate transport system substrate-binding protein
MKKPVYANCIVILFLLFFVSFSFAGELDRFAGLKGQIDIAGGTAHIPVMEDAAKAIMTFNPDIRITIAGGGSGVGVVKVGEGLVQIGNTGRALSDKEKTKFPDLQSFPFAIDGVAPITHPANKISGIASEQIRDIFAGKITHWKEVGGTDTPIHLYSRDEASGTREVFWKKCLKKGEIAENANIVPSNGAMKLAVFRDPQAIGYMSIGHIDATIKPVALDGVVPSQENAVNGSYPVLRKLYMNTRGTPGPLVQAFIDYVKGPEGEKIISEHGYIPLD